MLDTKRKYRQEFVTIKQAKTWLDANGWIPQHGGGYVKYGYGLSTLFAERVSNGDQSLIIVEIEAN